MTADAAKTVAMLRDTFDSGKTRPAAWRKTQLKALRQLLTEGEDEIAKAMREDLGKAPAEGWVTASAKAVATAASTALPPCFRIARPASAPSPVPCCWGRALQTRPGDQSHLR